MNGAWNGRARPDSLEHDLRVRLAEVEPSVPWPDRALADSTSGRPVATAILGAGPAGLTAAYVLARRGQRGAVFEADGSVGGIAKTVAFNGYRFDLGGHRFYTKLKTVQRMWEQALGEDLLVRDRLSRIYYRGKYFVRCPTFLRRDIGTPRRTLSRNG